MPKVTPKPQVEVTAPVKHIQKVRGLVTKLSSNQTVRVETKITKTHPIYKKRYTVSRHYLAHNPNLEVAVGDLVIIESCRPISKLKHYIVASKVDDSTRLG